MKLFLDSSVLVPVFLAEHPHHAPSLRLYTQCDSGIACCASHSLAEVYSTLTRLPLPHRATPDQAIEFLESIHSRFQESSPRLIGGGYLADTRRCSCGSGEAAGVAATKFAPLMPQSQCDRKEQAAVFARQQVESVVLVKPLCGVVFG